MDVNHYLHRTAEEAEAHGRQELGLTEVHKHRGPDQLWWMPGQSHAALNRALREAGKPTIPEPTPQNSKLGGRGGGMGGGMDMSMGMGDAGGGRGLYDDLPGSAPPEDDDEDDGGLFPTGPLL